MTPPMVPMPKSGTVVDARVSLAMWLRGGRSQRNMSLEDVARITKIQVRILERLESGSIKPGDGMPADVFVRGFVRSIAKCVGLDEAEALRRYSEAAAQAALDPSPVTAGPAARAFVESMSELAPAASRASSPRLLDNAPTIAAGSAPDLEAAPSRIEVIEIAATEIAPAQIVTEPSATDGKKKSTKKAATGKGRKRKAIATGTPFEALPVVAQPIETTEIAAATAVDPVELPAPVGVAVEIAAAGVAAVEVVPQEIIEPSETWAPKMPVVVAPTVPWRINASARSHVRTKAATGRIVPSLVIDDSDPDLAERELEDRATRSEPAASRSFLPSILRDREDRSARQGGLTLAVIILLIAATLTLSYLMRRPSSSGDGVTKTDLVESVDQLA